MNKEKVVKIAILGMGTVGGGTYKILKDNRNIIENRICKKIDVVKALNRSPRPEYAEDFITDNIDDILDNEEIDIVVECLGGIEPATTYMIKALERGKHVVTANKAAVAANYKKLMETSDKHGVKLLFEAAVAGGIPVLTAINNPLQANNFIEIMGILNGTTNYILTKMQEGQSYEEALKDAQKKGFAEADPTADVEGIDAVNKLSILITLMFDKYVAPEEIERVGISKVTIEDILDAKSASETIKLIGRATLRDGKLSYSVKPERISLSHPLSGVDNEFNAVYLRGDMVGELMFYGKGAGALPTGSAIVGDIISIAKTL